MDLLTDDGEYQEKDWIHMRWKRAERLDFEDVFQNGHRGGRFNAHCRRYSIALFTHSFISNIVQVIRWGGRFSSTMNTNTAVLGIERLAS